MTGTVRPATAGDVERMQTIGEAAGRRFASVDDPRVAARANDEPFSPAELQRWIDAGRAWVVDDVGGAVGFVVVDVVDANAHVEEISVHPDHEGRGHGGALLDAVSEWAGTQAMTAVTLTTFTDVAWNRPYYERRGFLALQRPEIGPELATRVAAEDAAGLPAEIRVCMKRGV